MTWLIEYKSTIKKLWTVPDQVISPSQANSRKFHTHHQFKQTLQVAFMSLILSSCSRKLIIFNWFSRKKVTIFSPHHSHEHRRTQRNLFPQPNLLLVVAKWSPSSLLLTPSAPLLPQLNSVPISSRIVILLICFLRQERIT